MDYLNDELEGTTEKELESLCIQFIEILNNLRDTGKISDEDYDRHTKLKLEYVNLVSR